MTLNNPIAIDYETYLISKEMPTPKPVCLSWADASGSGLIVGMEDMEKFLSGLLAGHRSLVAHNAAFELTVTDEWFPNLRGLLYSKVNRNEVICTKIYEQLLDNVRKTPIMRFDLATLVNKYFETDISADKKDPDAWRLRYSELDGVPLCDWPDKAVQYAIDDSIWTLKLITEQTQTWVDYELSVQADFWLNKMGKSGMRVDHSRVMQLKEELNTKIAPARQVLIDKGFAEVDKKGKFKRKMKLLQAYIEEHVEAVEKTVKGVVSTSSESLNRYISTLQDKPEVKEVLENYLFVMEDEKILTAFIGNLEQAEPFIRSEYNAVVSTGRTSCRSSTNYPSLNVQQMPRQVKGVTWDIRNCFVPREGYKIVGIDYSGLELTSAAHQLYTLTGRTNMRDILNQGDEPTDMHSMLAYRLMNIKEKTNETYQSFVANKKKEPYKHYRQLAKPINLGFPGGIGYDTMRSLLAKEGIFPKLVVLDKASYEDALTWKRDVTRKEGYPTRIRRTGFREFQLVYDELVQLKGELLDLYPDLGHFLTDHHNEFLTGETKPIKDEWGEWVKEPMYRFTVDGFQRDWCQYTQVCNGMLMQSPSAIGAKKAVVKIMKQYSSSNAVRPLAFIHDEILFEVLDCEKFYAIIEDLSEIMIDEMQTVLTSVRVAVEAEAADYWMKSGGFYSKQYWKDPGKRELRSK